MAGLKATQFHGLQPRLPASLLPPTAASDARNCDFAYGELRGLKDEFMVQTLNNAAQSIYTDDGLLFYSWPFDVDAERSPLASDTFDRLYYTTPTDFRVTQRSGMRIGGGVPASSYKVGVPRPSVAPTLQAAAAPSLSNSTITATFYYEYSGVLYQEQSAALTPLVANEKWRLAVPARSAATPAQAYAVLKMVAVDNTNKSTVFSVYSLNSSLATNSVWKLTLAGDPNAPPTTDENGIVTNTSLIVQLQASYTDSDQTSTAYVYTYVNTYGEEGPPSPPTIITTASGVPITATVIRDATLLDYAPIKEIRLYRTQTGTEIAEYYYSTSLSVLTESGTSFSLTDSTDAAGLNEPLSSEDYYPPESGLVGLMALPNGIMCARKGNELHFSEAYKPWAWPPRYVKTYKHALVGGMVWGSGALITTTVSSFLVAGVSPDSMTESKTGLPQGGLTKWAMADVNGALVYASNDGLVVVSGATASLAYSENFFTRDVWRARYRAGFSTMRFAVWDGRLIVYSSTGAFTAFMLRFDEEKNSMTDLPSFTAACSFTSPLSDQCYHVRGQNLYQFAGGAEMVATWTSREAVIPKPVNMGAMQIICVGSWTITILTAGDDGVYVVRDERLLTTGQTTYRPPAGYLADRWKVTVSGTGRMRELRMTETMQQLKDI